MDNVTRIKQLEKDIKFYQDDYYKGGQSISDADFDDMWDELKTLDPSNPILNAVGSDIDDEEPELDGFAKAKHIIPMGSQQKAANPEEFIKNWAVKHAYPEYLVQYKLDGCLDFDTILETDKGNLTIGYIVENKIKCKVKSFDHLNSEIVWTPITNWFINENNHDWYQLITSDGKKIKITGNHKVYLVKEKCYRQVKDLSVGDEFEVIQ